MNQNEARNRAKELGGIAIGARWRGDRWLLGGWASQQDEEWIVVDLQRATALDDRRETQP